MAAMAAALLAVVVLLLFVGGGSPISVTPKGSRNRADGTLGGAGGAGDEPGSVNLLVSIGEYIDKISVLDIKARLE